MVYHNPERMGYKLSESRPEKRIFAIVTNKSVANLLGDRIWVVTGEGTPRKYFLYETLVVDSINRDERNEFQNTASGLIGQVFSPMIRIDEQPWFKTLRGTLGNFRFGLQVINNTKLIAGLTEVSSVKMAKPIKWKGQRGAGFGNFESNQEVEQAAIKYVKRSFQKSGWTVESVEEKDIGYDLLCTRGRKVEHVEVKGVKGNLCSFIITANELNLAHGDPTFKLYAVTSALVNPKLHCFSGAELALKFRFEPTAFWARPRA